MGFTQKCAEKFFELIKKNNIELLIDVRLNNQSQLAGFSKGRDLQYFLKEICNCKYDHNEMFAPTKDILDNYKKGKMSWNEYVEKYNLLLENRDAVKLFAKRYETYNRVLLLCSEPTPENCHRRLLAEKIFKSLDGINIKHI